MIFDSKMVFNFETDIIALLIILGLIMVPKSSDEKQNTGSRLFSAMGLSIVIGVASELSLMLVPFEKFSWGLIGLMIPCIVLELAIIALLFLFFIYTDFELYESHDHLKRHMVPYVAPLALAVVICLLLPWLDEQFDIIEGPVLINVYVITLYIEVIYLFLTVLHVAMYYKKFGEKRFLHPLSVFVPIICGALYSILSGFTGVFLGFSLGLLFLVFSRIDSYRFLDREYRFYNKHYLKYILALVESGKEDRKSIILFTANGNEQALSEILKLELPAKSEVITLGGGDFLYLSKVESTIELEALCSLILDASLEYDETHADKNALETSYRVFDDFEEMKQMLSVEG